MKRSAWLALMVDVSLRHGTLCNTWLATPPISRRGFIAMAKSMVDDELLCFQYALLSLALAGHCYRYALLSECRVNLSNED